MASSVVGTWTTGMPRMKVAATKPARSPITPPPSAITVVSRPAPHRESASVSSDQRSRVFCRSPGGIVNTLDMPTGRRSTTRCA